MSEPGLLKILEQKLEKGERVEALENEPELEIHLIEVYSMFSDLNECRQCSSYSYQPLTLSDILAAFVFYNINDTQRRKDYFCFIKKLDDAWMIHTSERIKASSKLKSKENKLDA